MEIKVSVPGSCGELVQGTRQGVPFLVTCPVDLYTHVTVTDRTRDLTGLGAKAQAALRRVLRYLGEDSFPYGLSLASELPIGKGMASSSADIAAVCFAVAAALDRPLTAPEVSRIAAGIEPTDGVFFPGIVRLNHMTGECLESLGVFPSLKIAVFDTGGAVDTLEFHQRKDLDRLSQANEERTDAALARLNRAENAVAIAQAATESALANQSILPKRDLATIIETACSQGALGVNAAHSGTILGVLFPPDADALAIEGCVHRLTEVFPHLDYLQSVRLISGGYTVQKREEL
ncbi:MAG: GHMP kinase [Schwartzia sp.]|nr:GHMP kinase [Schwartzia sp. (in: firmicutes)]